MYHTLKQNTEQRSRYQRIPDIQGMFGCDKLKSIWLHGAFSQLFSLHMLCMGLSGAFFTYRAQSQGSSSNSLTTHVANLDSLYFVMMRCDVIIWLNPPPKLISVFPKKSLKCKIKICLKNKKLYWVTWVKKLELDSSLPMETFSPHPDQTSDGVLAFLKWDRARLGNPPGISTFSPVLHNRGTIHLAK